MRRTGVVTKKFEPKYLNDFVSCYKEPWKEPKWNENWSTEDVLKQVAQWSKQRDLEFRIVLDGEKVVGFSIAYEATREAVPELADVTLPGGQTRFNCKIVYGAELGLLKEYRGQGIGSRILKERIESYRKIGYSYMIGRTAIGSDMEPLYKRFGYICLRQLNPEYPTRRYWALQIAPAKNSSAMER